MKQLSKKKLAFKKALYNAYEKMSGFKSTEPIHFYTHEGLCYNKDGDQFCIEINPHNKTTVWFWGMVTENSYNITVFEVWKTHEFLMRFSL